MVAPRNVVLAAAVSLIVAACGGDGASEGATTTPPTVPTSTSPSPTVTTMPPTTMPESTTTTTLEPGAHPVSGILWADILPSPDAGAVYRVDMMAPDTPMSHVWGVSGDLEARMEYGVEWFGHEGTYDRLVIGDGHELPGTPGLLFYFRFDAPWVVEFFAMEGWPAGNIGRGPEAVEAFTEPAILDLSGRPGETFMLQGDFTAIDTFGVDESVANVAFTLRDAAAGPVTVAAGTFEQAMLYEVTLSGPVVGGPEFVIEVTVGPGNLILEMSMPGAGIELLEPWG